MKDEMTISEAVSKIDKEVGKLMDDYDFPDEGDVRFQMHINNLRLIMINGIIEGRFDEVADYLKDCSKEELEGLLDVVRKDVADKKTKQKWKAAAQKLEEFLDGQLNRV